MKVQKSAVSGLLAILFAMSFLSVSACGRSPADSSASVESAGSSLAPDGSPQSFPLTVTDQAGRTVTFEKAPERIVSGYYISTSALIALGAKDKLVGIEARADRRNIYKLSAPSLCALPNVGSVKEFDLEGCAALKPDLAILPVKLKDAAESLSDLGIRVLLVNPEGADQMEEMLDILAGLLGTEAQNRAEALHKFIADTKAVLQKNGGEKPVVYMSSNSSFLSTAGKNMFQSDMIALAGGTNAAEEIEDSYWAEVSYEQILVWNPDVILLAAEASFTTDDVLSNPALKEVKAVKNGQVYAMPDKAEAWDSPVPGAILGSVYLSSILHEEMTEEACAEIIDSFYEQFYGFKYSEK